MSSLRLRRIGVAGPRKLPLHLRPCIALLLLLLFCCNFFGIVLGDDGAVEEEEDVAATPSSDLDSAGELNEKLAQLQALLKERGATTDMADLQEKLASLQGQLAGLGIGGANAGGQDDELREFINKCMVFALRKSGIGRSTSMSTFKKIAEPGSTVQDVIDSEFMKLSSVCILEATSEEHSLFKEGKLQRLPDKMVERAKAEDIKDVILQGIDDQLWGIMKSLAAGGIESMKEQMPESGLPMMWGFLALVPVLAAVFFLYSKFQAMQKEKSAKKEKKAAKKQK
eukprot:CAMPEP_0206498202 /NCGR_PEP_ID=MMETSP0324_2-20121206/50798_1 /ASSEMBLY_ACC=CAM_ASM_000836 /TAXON_ID=2866 /ORGANISM="Crypthecodinium cohnii, Strain Seligo" /LENGTH=282 /DNA_ID=CAMNT_0053984233 /DNA_START=157 /DNA_END=1005 /DNA_ORIENTATION=+